MCCLTVVQSDALPSVSYLLAKLVNVGVFPASPPISRSQPSFFQTTLPTIRARLEAESSGNYSNCWSSLLLGLPTNFTLRSVLISLLASLPAIERALGIGPQWGALVKREACLLNKIIGYLTPQKDELWETTSAIILGKSWDVGHARIFACWVSGGSLGKRVDENGHKSCPLERFVLNLTSYQSLAHLSIKYWRPGRHQNTSSIRFCLIINVRTKDRCN